jgi:uncharacterized membrane protein
MATDVKKPPSVDDEQNVYADVYRLLIAGMVVTNIFFVIGLLLALVHPRYFPLSAQWVRSQYHWRTVANGLLHGNPTSYLMLGSLLLIATPVARVIVSIYAFYVDRDYKYVAITGMVLLVILLTVFLGAMGLQ